MPPRLLLSATLGCGFALGPAACTPADPGDGAGTSTSATTTGTIASSTTASSTTTPPPTSAPASSTDEPPAGTASSSSGLDGTAGTSDTEPGLEGTLEIWWLDSEGGGSTLLLTPEGLLVLIDAGNPGDRDADRVAAVVEDELGADHIDLCIVTHYHSDHVGGIPPLVERVAIDAFWDHGDSIEQGSMGGMTLWQDYLAVADGKRSVVAPGEVHELGGLELSIVASHGALVDAPLPGAGAPNPACRGSTGMPQGENENTMSVGVLARFGSFELLDLGDLYWDQETALACPNDLVGPVDLYQTTHHGLAASGALPLVHGIAPLVAVMNNGPHKGGSPQAFEIVTSAPSAPDLWQVHRALDSDDAHNSEDDLVANLAEGDADEGHYLHARIDATGLIELTNGRNGHTRAYQAR